ncbi:hypothetical protein NL676_028575 [Syzygium grande]|nr:hypothetical protein NL676_028575 [Syzygium grande]
MAQSVTVEAQMELKSPAEKVYEIFRRKSYLLPEIAPHMVKDIKLLAGDWESVGSVRLWTYVAEPEDGLSVLSGGLNIAPAKAGLTYEKQNADVPDPDKYMEFTRGMLMSVDAYLLKA